MEIKFWDKSLGEYVRDLGYYVTAELDVYMDYGYDGVWLESGIEPHFYKDGERIA